MTTPKDLLAYLHDTLDCDSLRRLDLVTLGRLENLLHHWYAMVGDIRRQRVAAATGSQLARGAAPGGDSFTLQPPAAAPASTPPEAPHAPR